MAAESFLVPEQQKPAKTPARDEQKAAEMPSSKTNQAVTAAPPVPVKRDEQLESLIKLMSPESTEKVRAAFNK